MGDISELRGIVTIVSFMGIFVFLATLIPLEFFTFSPERQVDVPEHFEAMDIQFFADTENFTVNHDPYFYDHSFGLGGWNLLFRSWKSYALVPIAEIRSYHYASWWIFAWDYKQFDWHDENGVNYGNSLTFDELDSIWNSQTEKQNETMKFIIKTEVTQLTVFFGWNTTEYSKPSDALNNNEMDVLYAVNMDQVNTSMNLWSLIGMLVFFNIPDVHPALNIIIKIPFWVTTAYLVYVLAIKIIPFIAGG